MEALYFVVKRVILSRLGLRVIGEDIIELNKLIEKRKGTKRKQSASTDKYIYKDFSSTESIYIGYLFQSKLSVTLAFESAVLDRQLTKWIIVSWNNSLLFFLYFLLSILQLK